MAPDIGDIKADHSPAQVLTVTDEAALESTPCTLVPTTSAVHVPITLTL